MDESIALAITPPPNILLTILVPQPGGKAKPLKQAKKQSKDYDDDDKAFLDKKRAGTTKYPNKTPSPRTERLLTETYRREGPQGDGGQGRWQGPSELGRPGNQEERQEISEG